MNAYVAELTLLVVRLTDRLADGVPPTLVGTNRTRTPGVPRS